MRALRRKEAKLRFDVLVTGKRFVTGRTLVEKLCSDPRHPASVDARPSSKKEEQRKTVVLLFHDFW